MHTLYVQIFSIKQQVLKLFQEVTWLHIDLGLYSWNVNLFFMTKWSCSNVTAFLMLFLSVFVFWSSSKNKEKCKNNLWLMITLHNRNALVKLRHSKFQWLHACIQHTFCDQPVDHDQWVGHSCNIVSTGKRNHLGFCYAHHTTSLSKFYYYYYYI